MSTTSDIHHMEALSSCPAAPPPPPPPAFSSSSRAQSRVLPQQQTPQPKSQLKHVPWEKIPSNRVARSENLWTEVGQKFDGYRVNFDQIEQLFAVKINSTTAATGRDGITQAGETGATDEIDGRKRQCEMQLLDCKRSMNVNIFLRQFHGKSHSDIVRLLQTGDSHQLGADKLRQLSKILPEQEELALLKQFTVNTDRVGQAERFFLQLIAIPHYELLIESLLAKEEFHQSIDTIRPALDAIIYSARDIKQSAALHELIYAVLITGNFLNTGFYGGDAAGIQLSSLLKLTEIQSNRPGMNLMHYVAQEVAENNPKLLSELRELKYLQEAASYPVEILRADVKQLEQQVKSVYEQISKTELHFQQRMLPFLELARDELQQLFIDLQEVEQLRVDLAVYFCEDVETFNLDYCLSTFNTFCQKFLSAAEENRLREEQLEKSRQRRVSRETNQGGADDTINSGNTNVYHTTNSNNTLPKNFRTCASVPEIRQPADNNNSIINNNNNNNNNSDQFNPDELESCLLRPSRGAPEGGSFRRSRSRHSSSRLSTEFFDRERTSRSPQSQQQHAGDSGSSEIIDVEQTKSVDDLLNPAAVATGSAVSLLRRGSSVRSSCPSRVDSTKRRARHAETQQQKADDTEPAAVTSKSGSGTERKRERCDYDLSGSSINILSPCAKLLSLCADSPTETELTDSTVETMASKWLPEEPQTGRGRTASDLVSPTADSSSELHRLAAVRKERFKRLSELYSNYDDDDAMNSRRSVTGSGGSEWTQQSIGSVSGTSPGDDSSSSGSGSVVDERSVLRSVSDMSCCEDEGFVSDCAASVVSQVNINTARPTPSPSSSLLAAAAAGPMTAPGSGQRQLHHKPAAASSTNSRSAKPTTTTSNNNTTTTTSRRTAATPSTTASRRVGPPSKSAQAMSRGIISRLMAATASSARRTVNTVSDGQTSSSSPQSTSTQSVRGKLAASATGSGKTTSRTNTVRSRSQPPANRPSLSTPAAAVGAPDDAEDERTTAVRLKRGQLKSPHGAEATMMSGAASIVSDDQAENSNRPRPQKPAVRESVFTRLSADRSSAAARSSRQNASSSTAAAAAAAGASPFVRAAASRSSMPSSFARNAGSKSVSAVLRVAGDIAGRAPTTVKSPAARQRTTSTDRVVRDHTTRRLDSTDAERSSAGGPTLTVVDINLQDTDTESTRPTRPSRPTAAHTHTASTTRSSPGKPSGMLTVESHHVMSRRGDRSPVSVSPVDRRKITNDSTAKTSAAKSSSYREQEPVISSSRQEYFV